MTTQAKPSKGKNQERTTPKLAEAWDVVAKTAGKLFEDLLQVHRDEILKCYAENGGHEYALSAALNFKGAVNAPLLKLKMSWTTKYSDEASEQIDDGTQTKLPFEGEDPGEAAEHRRRVEERRRNNTLKLTGGPNFEMGEGSDVQSPEVPSREPLALPPPSVEQVHTEGQQGEPVGADQGGEVVEGSYTMVEHPEAEAPASEAPDEPAPEPEIPDALRGHYDDALKVISEEGKCSPALLQRKLKIGYVKSTALLDLLEKFSVIGPKVEGVTEREILALKKETPEATA